MQNKKGVSLMVAYVLLIVIAVGLSVAAYNYLKLYIPSERPDCQADVSLSIEVVTCQGGNLKVALTNRGLFNADGAFIRLGKPGRTVRQLLNNDNTIFIQPLSPGETSDLFLFRPSETIPGGNFILEVQPAVLSDRILTPCASIISQDIVCTAQGAAPQTYCGDGEIQTPNDNGVTEECEGTYFGDATCATQKGIGYMGQLRCESCRIISTGCILPSSCDGYTEEIVTPLGNLCDDGEDNDCDEQTDCSDTGCCSLQRCSGNPNCISGDDPCIISGTCPTPNPNEPDDTTIIGEGNAIPVQG